MIDTPSREQIRAALGHVPTGDGYRPTTPPPHIEAKRRMWGLPILTDPADIETDAIAALCMLDRQIRGVATVPPAIALGAWSQLQMQAYAQAERLRPLAERVAIIAGCPLAS